MARVLLINPAMEFTAVEGIQLVVPLGLLYIGAVLEQAGHLVKIVDCPAEGYRVPSEVFNEGVRMLYLDAPDGYFEKLMADFEPDFVGISNLFATTEDICLDLTKRLKELRPTTRIVLGGTNATARASFLMTHEFVDNVILGEGEYAMKRLVEARDDNELANIHGLAYRHDNKVVITDGINWVKDLNALPFPAYYLLENSVEDYFTGHFGGFHIEERLLTMTTSRGCVRNCIFCSGMKYLGHWRPRTPENVIAEMEMLKEKFQIKEVAFLDANISLKRDRFVRIMNLMAEKKLNIRWSPFGGIYIQTFTPGLVRQMKRTGCHSICLAVEHGDERMQRVIGKIIPLEKLKRIVKECKKVGIWSHGYFVLGLPGETDESIENSFRYAVDVGFDSISVFVGTPLPGSRLYDEHPLREKLDFDRLRFQTSNINWTEMPYDELQTKIKKFMRGYLIRKIISELNPLSVYWRLGGLSFADIKLYSYVVKRFLVNYTERLKSKTSRT